MKDIENNPTLRLNASDIFISSITTEKQLKVLHNNLQNKITNDFNLELDRIN